MASSGTRDTLSLVEQVYDSTRRAILEGRYRPGQRLRLQDIAAENQVSFIPVREALRLLEAGRLVEIIPNKGARVSDMSDADMMDAYSSRMLLESAAIAKACKEISKGELETATGLYKSMVRAFEEGEVEESSRLHHAFHLTLYTASRSPWLIHLIQLLTSNTDRYRRLLTPKRPTAKHLDAIRKQHSRILEAVKARDAKSAVAALKSHLTDTQARFKAGLVERT